MPKEYTVGYRKPPQATRFKPGQSGNPKGRPKGSPNLAADLSTELGELITVAREVRRNASASSAR
jgi:hypothetical protein